MDEIQFIRLADQCLGRVTDWLEDFDPDELDFDTTDGVVSLEFPGGKKFILNRQAGNFQMWYAAGARAWHYDWDADREGWFDDRDGHELLSNIASSVSDKLGRRVELS